MKEKVGRPENWGLGLWFAKARTRRISAPDTIKPSASSSFSLLPSQVTPEFTFCINSHTTQLFSSKHLENKSQTFKSRMQDVQQRCRASSPAFPALHPPCILPHWAACHPDHTCPSKSLRDSIRVGPQSSLLTVCRKIPYP